MLDAPLSRDTEPPVVKRGRGRPPGSPNRPKLPPLSAEEADALKRSLAVDYAEAIVAEAIAADRVREVKAEIQARFGKAGVHVIGEVILEARQTIAPPEPEERTAERVDAPSDAIADRPLVA